MYYTISNEEKRIPETLRYIEDQLKEINRQIIDCDYYEDPDGNLVYLPNVYAYEKSELLSQKHVLEAIHSMLTEKLPINIEE